jgi:hypothetical protein
MGGQVRTSELLVVRFPCLVGVWWVWLPMPAHAPLGQSKGGDPRHRHGMWAWVPCDPSPAHLGQVVLEADVGQERRLAVQPVRLRGLGWRCCCLRLRLAVLALVLVPGPVVLVVAAAGLPVLVVLRGTASRVGSPSSTPPYPPSDGAPAPRLRTWGRRAASLPLCGLAPCCCRCGSAPPGGAGGLPLGPGAPMPLRWAGRRAIGVRRDPIGRSRPDHRPSRRSHTHSSAPAHPLGARGRRYARGGRRRWGGWRRHHPRRCGVGRGGPGHRAAAAGRAGCGAPIAGF